jgi:hypothetical protein
MHRIHSVPLIRLRELSVTSTSIGHTFLHIPQEMHFSLSHLILIREKRLIGFRNTVTGQMYLQKARLSFRANARIIPTA